MEDLFSDEGGSRTEPRLESRLADTKDPHASDALARKYYQDYDSNRDPDLLNRAILCARRTLELCPAANPHYLRFQVRLARFLESRHQQLNLPNDGDKDLLEAFLCLDLASRSPHLHCEHPKHEAKRLKSMLNCHVRLFAKGHTLTNFDRVVQVMHDSVTTWSELNDMDQVSQVYWSLAYVHKIHFKRCQNADGGGHIETLNKMIEYLQKSEETTIRTAELWVDFSTCKINYLKLRGQYNAATAEEDFRAAIHVCRLLMDYHELPEVNSPSKVTFFRCLMGSLFLLLATVTEGTVYEDHEDLQQATKNLQLASEQTPRNDPDWEFRFEMFQDALEVSTMRLGKPLLNSWIRGQRHRVLQILASENDEDQGEPQANELFKLATMHRTRYCSRKIIEDLIFATEGVEEAIAKTQDFDYLSLVERLSLAVECYYDLYREVKDLKCLRKGIEAGEKAMEALKTLGHYVSKQERAKLFHTLARCLAQLGEDENNCEMMQRAIQLGESAVEERETDDDNDDNGENENENEDDNDEHNDDDEHDDDEENEELRTRDLNEYLASIDTWKRVADKLVEKQSS